jgi:hypothetical protein
MAFDFLAAAVGFWCQLLFWLLHDSQARFLMSVLLSNRHKKWVL